MSTGHHQAQRAVITKLTNYQDTAGGTGTYTVKAVTNGVEGRPLRLPSSSMAGYLNVGIHSNATDAGPHGPVGSGR